MFSLHVLSFAKKYRTNVFFRISIAECIHAYCFFEIRVLQCDVLAAFYCESFFFKKTQKLIHIPRLFRENIVYRFTKHISVRDFRTAAEPFVVSHSLARGILYHRQAMFQANSVAQSSHGFCAVPEISELAAAIESGRIPDHVVVYVVTVNVCADDKCVSAFQESLGKFISDSVRFFRCDFPRFERLSELVRDYVIRLLPSGFLKIDLLTERKFFRGGLGSAFIR